MRLPYVSRETYESATAHAAYVSGLYAEEARRHDATRAELSRVTEKLAQIAVASAAPIAAPTVSALQGLADVVTQTVDEIADGDTTLRAVLRKRAVQWRKRYPSMSDDALAECLRTNTLPAPAIEDAA